MKVELNQSVLNQCNDKFQEFKEFERIFETLANPNLETNSFGDSTCWHCSDATRTIFHFSYLSRTVRNCNFINISMALGSPC